MNNQFDKRFSTNEINLKYAKGMRDIYGKEFHSYYEIFYFLGGDAEFITDNGKYKIAEKTIIVIPKETFHQFVVYGQESDYIRMVLSFNNVNELNSLIESKLNEIILTKSHKLDSLFFELEDIIKNKYEKAEADVLLKSILAQIVVCIKSDNEYSAERSKALNEITKQAIYYITDNLKNDLSINTIANKLHVSKSYLTHVFKNDLQISIHQYILQKRLMVANNKIHSGLSATEAAADSGFLDYSVFFRQYVKMFGISPSSAKRNSDI